MAVEEAVTLRSCPQRVPVPCSGTPIFTDEIEHTHFGGAAYNVDLGQKTYRYRVRPNYGYHCPHAYQLWSDCTVTGSWNASPPDTPSVIPGFYGAIGKLLAVFSREQNAQWYEMEISQDTTNNVIKPFGTLVWDNATLLNHQVQIDNDLCNNFGVCGGLLPYGGTHWFVVIGETQALTHYFYRVKACNAADCSPPSAYSEWNEAFPGIGGDIRYS